MINGSPAYVRLRYLLAALNSGQDAVIEMAAGLDSFKSATNLTSGLSSLLTGTHQAHDSLLCAVSIADRYKPTDKDDDNARYITIVAFNQEAKVISEMEARIKEQVVRPVKDQTAAVQLKDAEQMTAMTSLQQEAADSLLQVTSLSLMETVDVSDPSAKNTSQTLLSCTEFEDIRKRSTELSHGAKSAYSDAASLFVSFVDGHKCKA
jgi:hypothetical protein